MADFTGAVQTAIAQSQGLTTTERKRGRPPKAKGKDGANAAEDRLIETVVEQQLEAVTGEKQDMRGQAKSLRELKEGEMIMDQSKNMAMKRKQEEKAKEQERVEKLNDDIKQLCTILDEAPEKHKKANEKDCMAELEALQHRLTLMGSKTAAIQLYKMGLWGLELLLQKPVFGYRLVLDGLSNLVDEDPVLKQDATLAMQELMIKFFGSTSMPASIRLIMATQALVKEQHQRNVAKGMDMSRYKGLQRPSSS